MIIFAEAQKAPSTRMQEQEMARPEDQVVSRQHTPKQKTSKLKPDQADRGNRRIQDTLEDDEVRETLKSLHEFQDRRPKVE